MPNWKTKKSNNFEQRKKGFTPNRNFGHTNSHKFPNKNFQGSNSKGNPQQNPPVTRNKEFTNNHNNYVKNYVPIERNTKSLVIVVRVIIALE